MTEVREYDNDRDSLIDETKAKQERLEEQQSAMLEAVADGDDFEVESYEWVSLGNVDLKVKAWFPGETLEEIAGFASGEMDIQNAEKGIDANISALTSMTEIISGDESQFDTTPEIRSFWKSGFGKWGDQFLAQAVETVITPAKENSDTEDVVDSFRGEKRPTDRGASEWRS